MATPGNMTPGEHGLAEAARIEAARVYGTTCREHSQSEPVVETASGLFTRPADTYYGAAAPTSVADLLDAIVPSHPPMRSTPRIQVEQAIARGLDDEQISYLLDVETSYAADVRAQMDRAAS